MGLPKGRTNNPAGRKTGTPNRSTAEIKTAIQNLLDSNIERMEKDLQELTPKERLQVLLKLSDFILPRVQSVAPEGEGFDHEIIIRRV